jgi:MFS family permease
MIENAQPSRRRIVVAGLVGNVMESYDFAVYGYFAAVLGPQFFPSDRPAVSLIAAFGAFAAGFLVRPLGGLVFGRVADLVGRKHALTLSVLAMALPTVLIAFLPTASSRQTSLPGERLCHCTRHGSGSPASRGAACRCARRDHGGGDQLVRRCCDRRAIA